VIQGNERSYRDPGTVRRRPVRAFLKPDRLGFASASLHDARGPPGAGPDPGQSLRILLWSHFVPAYDVWYDQFVKEWGDKNGCRVRVTAFRNLELPARSPGVRRRQRARRDLHTARSSPGLYHKHLLDVTDISERSPTSGEAGFPSVVPVSVVEGSGTRSPTTTSCCRCSGARISSSRRFEAADTWELARVAARTLKRRAIRAGSVSHCKRRRTSNWRSLLASFGGQESDARQNVSHRLQGDARGAPVRQGAVRRGAWTPEVFSWDDASTTGISPRASPPGSTMRSRRTGPRRTRSQGVPEHVYRRSTPGSGGQAGQRGQPQRLPHLEVREEPQAAKEFLEYLSDNWKDGMIASRGYNMPFLKDGYKKPMPSSAPIPRCRCCRTSPHRRFHGYPGPFTPAVQEVVATFLLPRHVHAVARARPLTKAVKWRSGSTGGSTPSTSGAEAHTPCTGRGLRPAPKGASQFGEQQDRVSLADPLRGHSCPEDLLTEDRRFPSCWHQTHTTFTWALNGCAS